MARLTCGRGALLLASILFTSSIEAQVDLITNGQFPTGLTGWAFGASTSNSVAGTCSYNAAVAPGIETLTSTAGFPALGVPTTNIALGSMSMTAIGYRSCVLYQDVAIPVGATTATITADTGIKLVGGLASGDTAIFIGLYPNSSVPSFSTSSTLGGTTRLIVGGATNGPSLISQTSTVLNVSSFGGTTARFAIIIAMQSTSSGSGAFIPGAGAVIGIGDIHLQTFILPAITAIAPLSGLVSGGSTITITGTNFTGATAVRFGSTPSTSFTVVNDTTITAVVPIGIAGLANVTVITPGGTSLITLGGQFLYSLAAVATPALSAWSMLALALTLAAGGYMMLRRQHA